MWVYMHTSNAYKLAIQLYNYLAWGCALSIFPWQGVIDYKQKKKKLMSFLFCIVYNFLVKAYLQLELSAYWLVYLHNK